MQSRFCHLPIRRLSSERHAVVFTGALGIFFFVGSVTQTLLYFLSEPDIKKITYFSLNVEHFPIP
jgi:hypothetical protein